MERLYRDPVHNIITLSKDRADDQLLMRLIDTPEFQRLRYIRQLGLAMFTYQGAEHSRFTHSIGVMHVMTRMLRQLEERYPLGSEARIVGRVAALLHDIGHGPFSHVIEKALAQDHERWTTQIINDPDSDINRLLREYDTALPGKITQALNHQYQPGFIGALVSSQLDADRLDYLLRDSLMTGVKYGVYDLEWILQSLEIDEQHDRIYISARGIHAIEEYLQARFYMFRQVYFHRTLRAAEALLIMILRRARELARAGRLSFAVAGSGTDKVLTDAEMTAADFRGFDDNDLMFHIKQWMRDPDPVLGDLARRFVLRRPLKTMDVHLPESARPAFAARARAIVAGLGFDPDYYVIEDRATDTPYYSYYRTEGKSRIYVERPGAPGDICDIAEVSGVIRALQGYELYRLCLPEQALKPVQAELRKTW
ncbi:MAG: HD domain-containing protein [Blastocatellia bacterium]